MDALKLQFEDLNLAEPSPVDKRDEIDEIEDLFLSTCSQEGVCFDNVEEGADEAF